MLQINIKNLTKKESLCKAHSVFSINQLSKTRVIYSNGEAKYLEMKKGFVMAGMPDYKYKAGTFQLNPGDKLYLYTDGVTEAENEKHELYGEERLLNCIQNYGTISNQELIEKIKENISYHVAGHIQFDDMTMMCIEARQ